MVDKYINRLNQLLIGAKVSGADIARSLNDIANRECIQRDMFVPLDQLIRLMNDAKYYIEHQPKPYQKIMFVEDGSVDVDALVEELAETNPEIKIVVYRQGSNKPTLIDAKEQL